MTADPSVVITYVRVYVICILSGMGMENDQAVLLVVVMKIGLPWIAMEEEEEEEEEGG